MVIKHFKASEPSRQMEVNTISQQMKVKLLWPKRNGVEVLPSALLSIPHESPGL